MRADSPRRARPALSRLTPIAGRAMSANGTTAKATSMPGRRSHAEAAEAAAAAAAEAGAGAAFVALVDAAVDARGDDAAVDHALAGHDALVDGADHGRGADVRVVGHRARAPAADEAVDLVVGLQLLLCDVDLRDLVL